MKRCSTSNAINKMQIKTKQNKTMNYHYAPVRMAKIQNTDPHWMLVRVWGNGNSFSLLMEMQNGTVTLEDSSQQKETFTIQSSNRASWYLPKELKTFIYTKPCTQMCIVALFVIPKLWSNQMSFSRWMVNWVQPKQWNIIQCWKERRY